MEPELSTLSDDLVVLHTEGQAHRYEGLESDTEYEFMGVKLRTMARPAGELLSRFCTVNDLHFGEEKIGGIGFEGEDAPGPILHITDGERPYVDIMNESAIIEMSELNPDLVLAKGDLTTHGTKEEFAKFLDYYSPAFGERLVYVRGNHEAYGGEQLADFATQQVQLPGVNIAMLDTVVYGKDHGQISESQVEWLDDLLGSAEAPTLVFAHHHPWNLDGGKRDGFVFGLTPDATEAVVGLAVKHKIFRGYFAGHTHRNRVRRFRPSGDVPFAEFASVKDFPGAFAEYKVYEQGIMQVHHRVSSDEALTWTDKTRDLYEGMYGFYSFGKIEDRCFTIDV